MISFRKCSAMSITLRSLHVSVSVDNSNMRLDNYLKTIGKDVLNKNYFFRFHIH